MLYCERSPMRVSALRVSARPTGWAMLGACAGPAGRPGDPAVAAGVPERAPRTTQELMRFVQQAAGQVQREGPAAFEAFAAADGPWRHPDAPLFVLSAEGRALHHSGAPHLVGQEITAFTDMDGRPFVYWQLAALETADGTSWAFYQWPRPQNLNPTWIAAFTQRTTGRDGRSYVVGAGVFRLPVDATLLREMTAMAADWLERDPDTARRRIDDPQGPFAYRDVRVLVADAEGRIEAGPETAAIPPDLARWMRNAEAEASTFEARAVPGGASGDAHARRVEAEDQTLNVIAIQSPR